MFSTFEQSKQSNYQIELEIKAFVGLPVFSNRFGSFLSYTSLVKARCVSYNSNVISVFKFLFSFLFDVWQAEFYIQMQLEGSFFLVFKFD